MSTASRRAKWNPTPPPPPSPKILHFPRTRRTRRRKHTRSAAATHPRHSPLPLLMHRRYQSHEGKLENPFGLESPKASAAERRERVEENDRGRYSNGGGGGGFEEEKWRFQAEILRAECNLLRMEREFALKKLEKNRVKMERTLRSAVQTLVSGRKKIFEGQNVNVVLEEEIEDLAEKLEELQKSSGIKDYEVRNCSNFDKEACLLQRRLENLGGLSKENSIKDLKELAEPSLCINVERDVDITSSVSTCRIGDKSIDVDMLRKKMEGLSKGFLDRVEEEYDSILSSSVASSASTSKRIDCPESSNFSTRQLYQEPLLHENKCSGRCKAIVRRVVEQVRAETEQWSQMQEMLAQVRGEMEELQASRDFWENRAYNSDYEIQSLRRAVEEWKEKSLGYENKVNELQLELSTLKQEIRKSNSELPPSPVPLAKQIEKEKLTLRFRSNKNRCTDEEACKLKSEPKIEEQKERTPKKDLPPLSLGKQLAKEKKMLLRRLKDNRHDYPSERGNKQDAKRSPLMDIYNNNSLSPLTRQSSRSAFGFHSPESSRIRESFRKVISFA